MKFKETYVNLQDGIFPDEVLVQKTLATAAAKKRPPRHWKRPVAAAAALLLMLSIATPVLAVTSETAYGLMYLLSPAMAQFFQPVQRANVSSGIRVEVDGDTARAYITLQDLEGDRVDETTDLYDSYSLHVPFDSIGHCQRLGFDEETKTVTFLVTVGTMNGEDIPSRKQSFTLRCFLSQKETLKRQQVALPLADYAAEHAMTYDFYNNGGGGLSDIYDYDVYGFGLTDRAVPMLLPGEALAIPTVNIPITAAGYADGLFHVQSQLLNRLEKDTHCRLWLERSDGEVLSPLANASFRSNDGIDDAPGEELFYEDTIFDVTPEDLADYTLYGDFYTAGLYTEGDWRVTFPLENQ